MEINSVIPFISHFKMSATCLLVPFIQCALLKPTQLFSA